MSEQEFIPKSVEDFVVVEPRADGSGDILKQPITFNLQVIATDVPWYDERFKIKILMDIVPAFTTERNRDKPNFDSARTREILNFVSDKIITKVAESVYYDPAAQAMVQHYKDDQFPPGYDEVQEIYKRRRDEQAQQELVETTSETAEGNDAIPRDNERKYIRFDGTHEEAFPQDHHDERTIMNHVERLLRIQRRPLWDNERNISRISYAILSNPSFGVERRAAVNGDKKMPR